MTGPTHAQLLIPFAIALIDGHPTMRIAGLSLAAFISLESTAEERDGSERFHNALVLRDLVTLFVGLGCYLYALRLAVWP